MYVASRDYLEEVDRFLTMIAEEMQAEREANAAAQQQGAMAVQDEDTTDDSQGEENEPAGEQGSSPAQEKAGDAGNEESAEEASLAGSNSPPEAQPLDISPEVAKLGLLPDVKNLVYQRATSAQITQHFLNNSQMFSAPLPTGLYMEMQRRLYLGGTKKDNAAHWVVFYRDKPEKILCSCTAYARHAVINQGRGMEPVTAVMISELFTLPEYRRRGLATTLLKSLQRTLDHGTDKKKVTFSIIYSDSNTNFYDRLGWKLQPATHLRITLGSNTVELPPETQQLFYATLSTASIAARLDVNMSKCRISGMKEKGKVYAQVLPVHSFMLHHGGRVAITKEFMTGRNEPTKSWLGAHFRDKWTQAELGA